MAMEREPGAGAAFTRLQAERTGVIEDVDYQHPRGLDRKLLRTLASSEWVKQHPAAAIDRLVHHCVSLELNIPSYRVEQAKKAKEEA